MRNKLMLLLFGCILLSGCGTNNQKVCELDLSENEIIHSTYKIEYSKDKVLIYENKNTTSLKDKTIKKEDLLIHEKDMKKQYKGIKEISYSSKFTKDQFEESIKVEVSEDSFEKLVSTGVFNSYVQTGKENYLSVKAFEKAMKASGYECK